MAFREVEKGPEEIGAYWKPTQVGDAVEGNIYEFAESMYNNRKQVQINLYLGEDENGEPIMTLLPSHADLKRAYVNLKVGDYIRVEVVNKIEPTGNSQYPKFIYKVLVDDDKFVEWDSEDDDEYFE
jgi:hypothetical protein